MQSQNEPIQIDKIGVYKKEDLIKILERQLSSFQESYMTNAKRLDIVILAISFGVFSQVAIYQQSDIVEYGLKVAILIFSSITVFINCLLLYIGSNLDNEIRKLIFREIDLLSQDKPGEAIRLELQSIDKEKISLSDKITRRMSCLHIVEFSTTAFQIALSVILFL